MKTECTGYDPTCRGCVQMRLVDGKWFAARIIPEPLVNECVPQGIYGHGVREYPKAVPTARSLSVMRNLPIIGLKECAASM